MGHYAFHSRPDPLEEVAFPPLFGWISWQVLLVSNLRARREPLGGTCKLLDVVVGCACSVGRRARPPSTYVCISMIVSSDVGMFHLLFTSMDLAVRSH